MPRLAGAFFIGQAGAMDPGDSPDCTAECTLAAHRARWLPNGIATFAAMASLVAAARETIRLEFYMVKPGEPAVSLLAGLLAARARGVRVRVLYDAFGSEGLPPDFFAPLQAAGGEVRVFSPARRLRLAFRDHRKLLVCDSLRAIVGGHNIGPEYAGDGVTRGWFDVALQIEGPVAGALAGSFEAMYALAPMNPAAVREFRRAAHAQRALHHPEGAVQLLNSGPGWRAGLLSRALRHDVARSRNVRCISGYFLPPTRMRRALRRCVARGGQVLLLLAGRSDVRVARYAAQHLYGTMLAGGARLYEYQPQVLHAKLFVIDDTVYVGSCNLDRRSLSVNYELLLRLEWPELAAHARTLFAGALGHSREVPADSWRRRRRWWEWLRARAAYWLLTRIDPLLASRRLRPLG
jgi:cardiolipin synthase